MAFGLGVALAIEGVGTQATTIQGQVKNALFDIAQTSSSPPGQMYVPGATLAAQPVPTPFQSGPNVTWVSEGPSPGINGQQGPSGNYQLGGLNTDCAPRVSLRGMAFHKFKIGQRVIYQPLGNKFPTRCVVTALLPERDGDFKYQIRRQGGLREGRER